MTIDLNPRAAHSVADIVSATAEARSLGRLIHRFKVPSNMAAVAGGIAEMGFVLLTPDDELMAYQRINNVPTRLAFELARESLREIGEAGPPKAEGGAAMARRRVSTGDGTSDKLWLIMHPKLRTLAITAYNHIHNPSEDDARAFLDSREVSTP